MYKQLTSNTKDTETDNDDGQRRSNRLSTTKKVTGISGATDGGQVSTGGKPVDMATTGTTAKAAQPKPGATTGKGLVPVTPKRTGSRDPRE